MSNFTVKGQYSNPGYTAAEWTAANPALAANVLGLETDTNKMKIGDGSTAWNSLAYSFEPSNGADWTIVSTSGADYTITSTANKFLLIFTTDATNRVINYPDATDADHIGQTLSVMVIKSGAGTVTHTRNGSAVFVWQDGTTSSTATSNGGGMLQTVPNGTDYNVISTGIWDRYSIANSGSNINREYKKFTDSTSLLTGDYQSTSHAYTVSGSIYRSPVFTLPYGVTFVSVINSKVNIDTTGIWVGGHAKTTSQIDFRGFYGDTLSGRTDVYSVEIYGTFL